MISLKCNKKYVVLLSNEERKKLKEIVSKGKTHAYRIRHANILLNVDEDGPARTDKEIAAILHCHMNTIYEVRRRYVEQGFEAALGRKSRILPPRKPILDEEKKAHLIALACSQPPPGHSRWSLRALANRLVELEVVETISAPTVMRVLKK
jgi:transposase